MKKVMFLLLGLALILPWAIHASDQDQRDKGRDDRDEHEQYTLGRTDNNSGGLYAYPANDYDLAPEWGRADFDRRHRVQLLGRVAAHIVDLGISASVQSAAPYSETIGEDVYPNARGTRAGLVLVATRCRAQRSPSSTCASPVISVSRLEHRMPAC